MSTVPPFLIFGAKLRLRQVPPAVDFDPYSLTIGCGVFVAATSFSSVQ